MSHHELFKYHLRGVIESGALWWVRYFRAEKDGGEEEEGCEG
jgi:hypothetical protein